MNGFLDETKYTIKTYFITTGRTSVCPFFCYVLWMGMATPYLLCLQMI